MGNVAKPGGPGKPEAQPVTVWSWLLCVPGTVLHCPHRVCLTQEPAMSTYAVAVVQSLLLLSPLRPPAAALKNAGASLSMPEATRAIVQMKQGQHPYAQPHSTQAKADTCCMLQQQPYNLLAAIILTAVKSHFKALLPICPHMYTRPVMPKQ